MNTRLKAEAKAFDKIIIQRSTKKFDYDLKSKKIFKFFYNNPWRYPQTRKIAFLEKIEFVKKNLKKKSEILDVGCGGGSLSFELARAGHKVTGIDISKKSIETALKTSKKSLKPIERNNIIFQNKSFDQISKEKKKFDAIVFFKTLHHLQNTNKIILKTKSLLKKKSKIIIVEPLRQNISEINIAFALLARVLATTWENPNTKIAKYQDIKKSFNKLAKEYTYRESKKGYDQSPNDNSINSSREVIRYVKKSFNIIKIKYKDAFKDKIIGGIRGNKKFEYIKFIDNFDNFLIEKNLAEGSTLMLVAKKK